MSQTLSKRCGTVANTSAGALNLMLSLSKKKRCGLLLLLLLKEHRKREEGTIAYDTVYV